MSSNPLVTDILSSARRLNVKAEILPAEQTHQVRRALQDHFVTASDKQRMWEGMKNAGSAQNSNAWHWLDSFLQKSPAVLIFDEIEDERAILFHAGRDIVMVLADMYGFEFYITDIATSYLLAFNHHNYLLADGKARSWLTGLSIHDHKNLTR